MVITALRRSLDALEAEIDRVVSADPVAAELAQLSQTVKGIGRVTAVTLVEDGSPAEIGHALGVVARARYMTVLADRAGLSRRELFDAVSGEDEPDFAALAKIAAALGLALPQLPLP